MDLLDTGTYFTGPACSPEDLKRAEQRLNCVLPSSYKDLLIIKNGGSLRRRCIRTTQATSWAKDHVSIDAILGVGDHDWAIDSEFGSRYMIQEWGYPDIGVVFCATPAGGHNAILLDYKNVNEQNEPKVVFVDDDGSVLVIANSFDDFLNRLEDCANFDVE